jgi:hypothetical protein
MSPDVRRNRTRDRSRSPRHEHRAEEHKTPVPTTTTTTKPTKPATPMLALPVSGVIATPKASSFVGSADASAITSTFTDVGRRLNSLAPVLIGAKAVMNVNVERDEKLEALEQEKPELL